MLRNLHFTVPAAEDGGRLDAVLAARFPTTARACVREAIRQGDITVNGRRLAKGGKVRAGDEVRVAELAEKSDLAVMPQPNLPLGVLYEDNDLIALNKPAGQPTHPLSPRETGTLLNALIGRYPDLARVGGDPLLPAVVHRLDTDTSGIVLAAKNDAAYVALRRQFRAHRVRKMYLALVHGDVAGPGRLDTFLTKRQARPCRMAAVEAAEGPCTRERLGCGAGGTAPSSRGNRRSSMVLGGPGFTPAGSSHGFAAESEHGKRRLLHAVTDYEPVERLGTRTLVRVAISTGVTHQVRCHLAHAGFPIVGDRLYGSPEEHPRHFLHAAEIAFVHPADARAMIIRSDPAPGFRSGDA